MTSLLKQLTTNAINWDIRRHSALATQKPQGQAPSLPSQWFNRTEAARSSQPACYRQPSRCWSQGYTWMWLVGPRISKGATYSVLTSCSRVFFPQNCTILAATGKTINKKIHLSTCCWDRQIFSHQFLAVPDCPPLLGKNLSLPLKSCSYCSPDRRCFKTLFWEQTN